MLSQHRYSVKLERCLPRVTRPRNNAMKRFQWIATEERHMQNTCIHDNTSFTSCPFVSKTRDCYFLPSPFCPFHSLTTCFSRHPFENYENPLARPNLPVRSMSFIQFWLETVQRLFHDIVGHRRTIRAYLRVFFENPSNVTQKCGFCLATLRFSISACFSSPA